MNNKPRYIISIPFSQDQLILLAQRFSMSVGTAFLHSGGKHECSEKSILGLFPIDYKTSSSPSCWEELEQLSFTDDSYPLWIGYLSYEMGAYSDKEKQLSIKELTLPHFEFYRYAITIIYDHVSLTATFVFDDDKKEAQNLPEQIYAKGLDSDTVESYTQKIKSIQEEILNGNVYQVNLSRQVIFRGSLDPFLLFLKLTESNPAPFGAFLHTPHASIISSSPERLLMKKGDLLETRPIKGTAPRGLDAQEDKEFKDRLLHSAKEKAELMMITDLMRNDLNKVSFMGSVKVIKVRDLEAYENVYHTVSVVQSRSLAHLSSIEILRSVFPGGSVTGCPKLSAMEFITKFEERARGVYTGSIGYFSGNGDFDFNIAIRTIQIKGEEINVQLGGAIVVDSDSKKEYEETIHKGSSIFRVLKEVLDGEHCSTQQFIAGRKSFASHWGVN